METTTIKVPVDLRDRLAQRARRNRTTIAQAIADSLDQAEEKAFWEAVRTTMGGAHEPRSTAEGYSGTLRDGLVPDEDWSDIL
jgi:hypothetical protein